MRDPVASAQGGSEMMAANRKVIGMGLVAIAVAAASIASALPIQFSNSDGARYSINTQVDPLLSDSLASGAVTNATFLGPVTVTNYWIAFTFWGGTSTFTTQQQVNVNLTPAFSGFNGLLVTSVNGQNLVSPLLFNTGQPLAGQDCPQNGTNRELIFPTQTFPAQNLSLTRKVFAPHNKNWVRWLNIITNTGSSDVQVGVSLKGLIASGSATKITNTSSGDATLSADELWFTTAQTVPQGDTSLEPRIGYVLQGPGATSPATSAGINSVGQAAFGYTPTIPPGGTAIVMTFVTVQGKTKQAKNTCENLVTNPLPSDAIKCMSEQELAQVVNFAPVTPPTLKKATVKLKFNKTGQDTVQWKGNVTIGAGISLQGLPVTVDFGGIVESFFLNKSGSANDGGGNKFNLQAKLQNGLTKAANVKFSFNLKGDLQGTLAAYGLTNADADDVSVTIPLTISVGTSGAGYAVDQAFTWNATAEKSGTAKAPPSS
jgi:hypothetical protein